MSYLFGSILTVPRSDLWIMLGVSLFTAVMVGLFYKDILALSYDPEFARIRGVPVGLLYFLLISMLAVAIVMIIQVVGLILVIALLTIPPSIMERHAKSLFQMILGSCLLGVFFTLCGLWLAYAFNLTSGATIIMLAGLGYLLSMLWEWIIPSHATGRRQAMDNQPAPANE
jgi:zinc transport system permease protein